MANFIATTVTSTPGRIKQGCESDLNRYLSNFLFDEEVTVEVRGAGPDACIDMYGYGWMSVYELAEDDDEQEFEDVQEEFFSGLAKFLASHFEVMSIGAEKCRYAAATRLIVSPDGKLDYLSL